jgi:pimeloyl-ACP methyl ester carboxylesterase
MTRLCHTLVGMPGFSGPVEGREVITRDGAKLATWVVGPPNGAPVLLASGGGADHRGWRSLLPELCESEAEQTLWSPKGRSLAAHCRVAVFDQRGTGASVHETPAASAKLMGSDIMTVIRAVLGEPCTVVGHSMGGMAALHAVLDCPTSVSALGLVATTAGGSGLTWPSDSYLTLAATDPDLTDPSQVRSDLEFAVSPAFRVDRPDLYEACVDYAITQPRAGDSDALAQVFLTHDVADRLGEISIPTVVICGTEDQIHPLSNSTFLADHIPASRLVVVEGAGHLLNAEIPELLIHEIAHLAGGDR